MTRTSIEWVARPGTIPMSWNPVSGCTAISPGCKHCYARRMARRLAGRYGYPEVPDHFQVTLHPDKLERPLQWKKPRTVFVLSMGDLFHKDVPFGFIRDVWTIFANARQHTYQVLTKRPARMLEFVKQAVDFYGEPFKHVWLGTTVETPEYLWRVDYLRQTPAAVRFLSLEPLLAPFADFPGVVDDMDQIIAGPETGPGARLAHPNWIRWIRDQCLETGTKFFFKGWGPWFPRSQWEHNPGLSLPDGCIEGRNLRIIDGEIMHRVGRKSAGRLLDGQKWSEWPA